MSRGRAVVARKAHNLEVVGSIPTPATRKFPKVPPGKAGLLNFRRDGTGIGDSERERSLEQLQFAARSRESVLFAQYPLFHFLQVFSGLFRYRIHERRFSRIGIRFREDFEIPPQIVLPQSDVQGRLNQGFS